MKNSEPCVATPLRKKASAQSASEIEKLNAINDTGLNKDEEMSDATDPATDRSTDISITIEGNRQPSSTRPSSPTIAPAEISTTHAEDLSAHASNALAQASTTLPSEASAVRDRINQSPSSVFSPGLNVIFSHPLPEIEDSVMIFRADRDQLAADVFREFINMSNDIITSSFLSSQRSATDNNLGNPTVAEAHDTANILHSK